MGDMLPARARKDVGVSQECMQWRFQGTCLQPLERPGFPVLDDYPSVRGDPEVAAMDLDRLPGFGGISRRPNNPSPPNFEGLPLTVDREDW